MNLVGYANKFLVALGGALAQLVVVMSDSSAGGSSVTSLEWVMVLIAGLTAAGVYAVANKPE